MRTRAAFACDAAGRWRCASAASVATAFAVEVTESPHSSGPLLLAMPNHLEDAELAAAAVNALPALFRALDAAEARAVAVPPVVGDVAEGGVLIWRSACPLAK